ncbi:MAG: HEPN domain-containing protein [Nitrososphaerota archaeon]
MDGNAGISSPKNIKEKLLLKKSKDFLETAEYQMESFFDLSAFSLEQTLQLFLKAKLLAESIEYPRTRSVRAFGDFRVVAENRRDIVKSVLEKYMLELSVLEDASITSRYVMRNFTRNEVERLVKGVKEIMKMLNDILPGGRSRGWKLS